MFPVIGAVIGAVGIGMQVAKAFSDKKKAKQLGKTKRPKYEISQILKDNYAKSKFNAFKTGQPGENILDRRIQRATAGGLNSAKQAGASSSTILSAVSGIQANENLAYEGLSLAGARYKDRQVEEYYRQGAIMAGEERAAWDWNEADPYKRAMAGKSAFEYSFDQNLYGAAMNAGNLAVEMEALYGDGGDGEKREKRERKPKGGRSGDGGGSSSSNDPNGPPKTKTAYNFYDDTSNRARAKELFGNNLSEANYKLLFG